MNIPWAYEDDTFNPIIDECPTYRTKSLICTPIMDDTNHFVGVMQVLNKVRGLFTGSKDLGVGRSQSIIYLFDAAEWNSL